MAHTPDEHCKMIVGLTVADLAWQLALARAENEQLKAEHAALTAELARVQIPKETPPC